MNVMCEARSQEAKKQRSKETMRSLFFTSLPLYLFASLLLFAPAAHAAPSEAIKILEEIPVQHNGRIKPFLGFARETVLNVTGQKTYENHSPVWLIWNWIADPDLWNTKPMIPVTFRPLRQELAMMLIQNRVSPQIVLEQKAFSEKIEEAIAKQSKKQKLTRIENERLALYHKAMTFREIGIGGMPGWIPQPEEVRKGWISLRDFSTAEGAADLNRSFSSNQLELFHQSLRELFEAFRTDFNSELSAQKAKAFSGVLRQLLEIKKISLDERVLKDELMYLRFDPFGKAWIFYVTAFLIFSLLMNFPAKLSGFSKALTLTGLTLFGVGFLTHSFGFYLRCVIAGRPPVTNMYESIIWVSWGICFFSICLYAVYRGLLIPAAATGVATLALIIAQSFPVMLDPTVSPLVPVLRSNMWLTIHVLTITLSYGAFALAWGIGHVVVASYAFSPQQSDRNKVLAQYLYRALQIGVILLAAGTVLGGVWANYSWGRFWGWDPKETWALIALLGYLTVLHARSMGLLDIFGLAAASVMAFAGVVMAWYGVNYVLAAGLHSYGFGGGGAPFVLGVVGLDFLWVGVMSWLYTQKQKALVS